jgi:zinc protease
LVVAVKFDPEAALKDIVQSFGKIPKPTRKLPPEYTVEAAQDGERRVTLRRTGGSPLVAAMYHVPSAAHKDFAALDLASMIIGDTPSGRLYKALVANKLAAGVFAFTMDRAAPGSVMFGASLQADMDQVRALSTLTTTVESIAKEPFTAEELDRVRNQWLKGWDQGFSDPQKISAALTEAIALGDWRLFFVSRDRIRAATLAEVQQAADRLLVQANRTEGVYIPTDKPSRAPQLNKPNLQEELKGYTGDVGLKQASAFDPDPNNIDARTQRKTVSLKNGKLQLALLPKESRGDRVQVAIQLQFGDVDSLKGQRSNTIAVADLLLKGTSTQTRQQITDRIDALGGQVGVSGAGGGLFIQLSTTAKHIDELTSYVLDVVQQANFAQEQLDEYVRKTTTSIKSSMTEPNAIASRMLARHGNTWSKDDIRYTPTFDESLTALAGLTREQLAAYHQKFFGVSQTSASAVGAFDAAKLEQTLTTALNKWNAGAAYKRTPEPYRDIKPAQMQADTPDKANAFYIAGSMLKLQDTDPDFTALSLANFMLGGSENSRLWMRIREKDGLSYNVRTRLNVSSFEPNGTWSVYAIYAPENRQRIEAGIREEFERALKDGFTETEVKEAIAALLNYRKLSRAQDANLVSGWIAYMETGRDFKWSAESDKKVAALTVEQVNAALRKYLQPQRFSSVAAGDFSKKK